jgi:hypothetical protein
MNKRPDYLKLVTSTEQPKARPLPKSKFHLVMITAVNSGRITEYGPFRLSEKDLRGLCSVARGLQNGGGTAA